MSAAALSRLFLTALIVRATPATAQPVAECSGACRNEVILKGSCFAEDVIAAGVIVTGKNEGEGLTVKNALSAGIAVNAEVVDAEHATGLELIATRIKAVTGELYLQGFASVSGAVHYKTNTALTFPDAAKKETGETGGGGGGGAFLEVESDFRISGASPGREKIGEVPADGIHWMEVSRETFDSDDAAHGWTLVAPASMPAKRLREARARIVDDDAVESKPGRATIVSQCGGNPFLGGPCEAGGGASLHRMWAGLRQHEQIRLSARVHFLGSWQGEPAFAKVDGQIVWLDTHGEPRNRASARPVSFALWDGPRCGGRQAAGPPRLGAVVEVVVPHRAGSVEIEFGAALGGRDACETSFGVDNVVIELR
jgi:hypothetical protein